MKTLFRASAIFFFALLSSGFAQVGDGFTPAVPITVLQKQSIDAQIAAQTLRIWQVRMVDGEKTGYALGSCTVIGRRTILTALHVVSEPGYQYELEISLDRPRLLLTESSPRVDGLDLMTMTVPDDIGITPMKIDVRPLRIGDHIIASGYAMGKDEVQRHGAVQGFISRSTFIDNFFCFVEIGAQVTPGMSGGPIVRDGKLVGVIIQRYNINGEGIFISSKGITVLLNSKVITQTEWETPQHRRFRRFSR